MIFGLPRATSIGHVVGPQSNHTMWTVSYFIFFKRRITQEKRAVVRESPRTAMLWQEKTSELPYEMKLCKTALIRCIILNDNKIGILLI